MEWGTITTLVAEVLFGGGLLVFVTIKDKKTAAILDNMQRVIEEERRLAEEYRKENKVVSMSEPTYAAVTSDGEVTSRKWQR